MSLHVTWPAALAGLLVVPVFVLLARGARAAGLCRAAAAAAVVLALAGLYLERSEPESGVCVVAMVDVSASMQDAGRDLAGEFFTKLLPSLGPADVVGSVGFAGRARVVSYPDATHRSAAALVATDAAALDPDETDLAAALSLAVPLCPETKQRALVLVSDGNETDGSIVAEAALTEPRVPIFPLVPPPARLPRAAVRRLIVPSLAPANAVLPLEAVVESRADAPLDGALELAVNGRSLRPVPLEMPPGVSAIRLPYSFEDAGTYLMEARLLLRPEEPAAPAPVPATITVTRPLRVLVVSERSRPVVALALAKRGMDVELTTPSRFAERVGQLGEAQLVVLDDVSRAGLALRALDALAQWVAGGGALVVTGGGHLFGDPGFVGTPLERLLPVGLESQRPEPKEREPIALYLLVDRSNSMGYASSEPALEYGEKMEYAKRAALAVLDQLGPRDLVGAIAFDSQPYELGALLPLAEGGSSLATKIRQLRYGGGTDFKEALATARRELLASGPRVRHVILITDGDTNRRAEDHDDLIAELARDEITVTTIRIGSDVVNLDLLERISRATGGAFNHVEDVQALPQLMISDTQHQIDAAAERRDLPVRVGDPGPILAGLDEDDLPRVSRWAITRPKPGAELRLWVATGERRDPLLATWQYELGRVAALPLDFQAGAAGWPTWPGFAKLWSQLAIWAARPGVVSDRRLEARRLRAGTLVRVATVADEPGPFVLHVPDAGDVALHPTGRRRFEGIGPALDAGVHPATLSDGQHEDPVELVVPARSASGRESRALGPNLALLERVAALTGGRVDPEPTDVVAARTGVRHRAVPLESVLIPLALVLILADVWLRRAAR